MIHGLFSCLMAASLAQAPSETALLKAVPADAEVVLRVRGIQSTRDELMAMVKAMSPTVAEQVEPVLTAGLDQMTGRFGGEAVKTPFLVAFRLPAPGEENEQPPFAVIVAGDDYPAIIKQVAGTGDAPEIDEQDGGFDSFKDQDGETMYSFDGEGFVAFGPMKDDVVKAIAAKPTASLNTKLEGENRAAFVDGDLGIYVNLARVQELYAEQIKEAREQFMALLDQAGQQMEQPGQMEAATKMYGALFDGLKEADSLTFNLDFDADAFGLEGFLTPKSDSPTHDKLAEAGRGKIAMISSLPVGGLVYGYTYLDPALFEDMAQISAFSMAQYLDADGQKKFVDAAKTMGRVEGVTVFNIGEGIEVTAVYLPEKPEAYERYSIEMMELMKNSPMVKTLVLETNLEPYQGFSANKATITFDIDKMLGEAATNPGATAMMKAMMGDGTITTYFGTNGKEFVSLTARDDATAQARFDALRSGKNTIGESAGFKELLSRLPTDSNMMMAMSAQGMVRVIGQLLGGVMGGEPIPAPADMPKEPAFLGGSLGAYPEGYRFKLVVPSQVGPALEKGMGPIIQGLQGQVNQ